MMESSSGPRRFQASASLRRSFH